VIDAHDGPREFRIGDQVLITRNDHRRQLLNGTAATITALGADGLHLRTRDGRDVEVDRPWLEAGQLDHGYAITLHKAQGRTVHTALLLADGSLGREAGYVGLSRGTHANHVYVASADDPRLDDDCLAAARPWLARTRSLPRARDGLMDHGRQQQLAIHQRPEARAL